MFVQVSSSGVEGVRGVSGVGISQLPAQIRRSLHEWMMMSVVMLMMVMMMVMMMKTIVGLYRPNYRVGTTPQSCNIISLHAAQEQKTYIYPK